LALKMLKYLLLKVEERRNSMDYEKRIRGQIWVAIFLAVSFCITGSASAVTVGLHTSNTGITGFSWSVSGNTITITETWGAPGYGFLIIDELIPGQNYTVNKIVTNNTGVSWDRFSNELLDPAGNLEDSNYDVPIPAWVPTGFSRSNDMDGLSFAQGSGIPRTSSVYPSLVIDELAGLDFLDFYGATVATGGAVTFSYGLRDNDTNQPFLLAQRPNEFATQVPEPGILILLGLSMMSVAGLRRYWRE
jgi:hypothetical protein